VQAANGNFYGTTRGYENFTASDYGYGTVFEITPNGTLTTLHSFCSQPSCADGDYPESGLVQGTDGNFYGTTSGSTGYSNTGGTVFRITPSSVLATLYTFCSQSLCADGETPTAALVQATNGDFFGTTSGGGTSDAGTIFILSAGLGPFVEAQPTSGNVGAPVRILGTALKGATGVSFNGTAAVFEVVSISEITTTVPVGASIGKIEVATPGGTLASNMPFRVR
jgi:uncharacterized repeat protein (TIGR03803 family)